MRIIVGETSRNHDLNLVPGQNLVTGIKDFNREFGILTSLEEDLLIISSAIYASDLAVKREEREAFIRSIEINIPVVNYHLFQSVKEIILSALFVLSSDNWTINFTRVNGKSEEEEYPICDGRVLLFSGGLDSYAAATVFSQSPEGLFLVSHITHNQTIETAQNQLKSYIEQRMGTPLQRVAFRVGARKKGRHNFPTDQYREDSQRTRSFLFLCLAALFARRKGCSRIINIAENGQFAIHIPLNAARPGPFSTHTAHPEFIHHMQVLFQEIFENETLQIINPFLYNTKSEVLERIPARLRDGIPLSVSCWKASRVSGYNHCGECIPCLFRRIALEKIGIRLDEYSRNLFEENISELLPNDNGKRNLIDLLEFSSYFRNYTDSAQDKLMEDFGELYNDFFNTQDAIELYRRMADDVYTVASRFPRIASQLR